MVEGVLEDFVDLLSSRAGTDGFYHVFNIVYYIVELDELWVFLGNLERLALFKPVLGHVARNLFFIILLLLVQASQHYLDFGVPEIL